MAANVNNYVRAGNAAVRKNIKIRQALAENKPRYDKIAQASVQADAKNKVNAATNNASTAKAKIESEAAMRKTKIGIDSDNKIRGYKKQARMTGMLAGGAALIGYGAMNMNKKDEPDEMLSIYKGFIDKTNSSLTDANAEITRLQGELDNFKIPDLKGGDSKKDDAPETATVSGGNQTNTGASQYAGLQGGAKTLADAIAKFESGGYGYEAFNQGGKDNGHTAIGSGNYKKRFGRSLTDMTIGEIFEKQYDDKTLSDTEWRNQGKLHAVGRYQFIGSTLKDEVNRMGLSHDTKFSPQVQDQIFLSHAKRVGNISPWVGPSANYSSSEKARFNEIIQGL